MGRIRIIAEAGVNHNGDIHTARKLVEAARECGADIVKFQTFQAESLASGAADLAGYQKKNLGRKGSQKDMLRKLALSQEEFLQLSWYCREAGITFLSTPFDRGSIRFLDPLQEIWKVPSGGITDYPYLAEIAATGKEVILSTGMSTLEEVEGAVGVLREKGAGEITLLHCTTDYPAPLEDVNLRAMLTMKRRFGCPVGYSDHTLGTEVSIAAAALGATVIEKHFTLDRNMEGPDHRASLEPQELAFLVRAVRNVEAALGDGVKMPSEAEEANRKVVRKSITAARDIKSGEVFSPENLTTKRPGTGISPMEWNQVMGRRAARDFREDELIEI